MNILKRQYWGNNLWYGEARRQRPSVRPFISVLTMPNTFKVWGLDVSHWNRPPVDFQRMKDVYGLSFVILKGCDGSINSRYYEENKAAVKAAGLPWGIYNWLYPDNKVSIDAQVSAWLARFAADPAPMGVFIDAEWTYYSGLPAHPRAYDLRMAHDRWAGRAGERATTYTAAGYADTYLYGFDWSREELWIANYGVATPLLPMGARGYTFWQFASTLDGHTLDPMGNAELDGNYFSGDHYQFLERYGGQVSHPGEPPTMALYEGIAKLTSTPNVRIRKPTATGDLNIEGMTIGAIQPGQSFKADRKALAPDGRYWLHIIQVGNNPIDGWSAGWLLDYREILPPVEPPPTEPTLTHTIQVYSNGSIKVDGNPVV